MQEKIVLLVRFGEKVVLLVRYAKMIELLLRFARTKTLLSIVRFATPIVLLVHVADRLLGKIRRKNLHTCTIARSNGRNNLPEDIPITPPSSVHNKTDLPTAEVASRALWPSHVLG